MLIASTRGSHIQTQTNIPRAHAIQIKATGAVPEDGNECDDETAAENGNKKGKNLRKIRRRRRDTGCGKLTSFFEYEMPHEKGS
jgi:hypothetical protein